jgi:catechol 2,3-dioxygenase-like lactoylglutathione lyase family enzyme
MHMLHHLSFAVADLSRAAAFYDPVLAALGYERVWTASDAIGYGPPGGGDKFAIKAIGTEAVVPSKGFHVAFSAATNAAVDAFHAAAVENNGADNGRPGLRPHYGPTYYAAFVIDPDGYRIEAVCK